MLHEKISSSSISHFEREITSKILQEMISVPVHVCVGVENYKRLLLRALFPRLLHTQIDECRAIIIFS